MPLSLSSRFMTGVFPRFALCLNNQSSSLLPWCSCYCCVTFQQSVTALSWTFCNWPSCFSDGPALETGWVEFSCWNSAWLSQACCRMDLCGSNFLNPCLVVRWTSSRVKDVQAWFVKCCQSWWQASSLWALIWSQSYSLLGWQSAWAATSASDILLGNSP